MLHKIWAPTDDSIAFSLLLLRISHWLATAIVYMETVKMEGGSHATYTCSYFQPISPAVALGAGSSETTRRDQNSHSLPTAHLLHNISPLRNYGNLIETPVPVCNVGRLEIASLPSLPPPATPGVDTSPMSPSTLKCSPDKVYFSPSASSSSSSTSSSNLPVTPTPLPRYRLLGQNNTDHYTWFHSTFYRRASQETESHHSDSSYYISEQSNASSNLGVLCTMDAMDSMDDTDGAYNNEPTYTPAYAPQKGKVPSADNSQNTTLGSSRIDVFTSDLTNIDPALLEEHANLTTDHVTTRSIEAPGDRDAVDIEAMDSNHYPYPVETDNFSTQSYEVARGGYARPVSFVRGRGMPRGRGGTFRLAKRARYQRDDGDDDYEEVEEAPKRAKKRQKATKEPESQPVEIHRRFTSLRDRLIKGVNTPQDIGMRAYKKKKEAEAAAKAAANAAPANGRNPREFLVPIAEEQDQHRNLSFAQFNGSLNSTNNNHWSPIHPNLRIAYKSTPIHQLHFPEGLVLALKQNRIKWARKAAHSEGLVFVVVRIVDSDIADMHVFPSLQDATVDALHLMVNDHPEAFALPCETDGDGNEIKPPRMERATSVIREITERPTFAQL
ncbi:hypothetical protein O1611_g9855 [Lasiodiplodia mahajangana]|uniref:Uncharacterized protein n=1 Tax=Lasiodiplodia mahajangana TaxID=1108764 RepID=A0ACC2J5D3_9PEZI|nr:hypothetical protein O1611_g9855 [Lasiodiplodia mahajangana]